MPSNAQNLGHKYRSLVGVSEFSAALIKEIKELLLLDKKKLTLAKKGSK